VSTLILAFLYYEVSPLSPVHSEAFYDAFIWVVVLYVYKSLSDSFRLSVSTFFHPMMRFSIPLRVSLLTLCVGLLVAGCIPLLRYNIRPRLSDEVPPIDYNREAVIFTALFGLDNALPHRAKALHPSASGQDGMPLVFSLEIDPESIDGSDFRVLKADGSEGVVDGAALRPATEPFELRTILLVGELGTYPGNEPVRIEIVGDLMSRTGVNFKGQSVEVIPLEDGPILSYAEYFDIRDENYPYNTKKRCCDCPREITTQVVKAVWAGGVHFDDNVTTDEVAKAWTVTLVQAGDTIQAKPFLLADLNDNDNNLDLCLTEAGTPIRLHVEAHTAMDPRDDYNPYTKVPIVSRW